MRVEDHSLTDQLSSSATRTPESQRIQVDTNSSGGSSSASGADRVDLSSITGRISQAMQTVAAQSAQRVSQLRQDFQAGSYRPDVPQLASALAGS